MARVPTRSKAKCGVVLAPSPAVCRACSFQSDPVVGNSVVFAVQPGIQLPLLLVRSESNQSSAGRSTGGLSRGESLRSGILLVVDDSVVDADHLVVTVALECGHKLNTRLAHN